MAEKYGFFNAVNQGGIYDRTYMAEDFAEAMHSFIETGVFDRDQNDLQVMVLDSPAMGVQVKPGRAWINGYWFVLDEAKQFTVDVSDGVQSRIDAIILQWAASERLFNLSLVKGTPAATNPTKYTPQRSTAYYELVLGYITVGASTANIQPADIEDTRSSTELCGMIANANLIGPISDETIDSIIV